MTGRIGSFWLPGRARTLEPLDTHLLLEYTTSTDARPRGAPQKRQCLVFDIILFQPEIPPNTGNIIRLCANTGAHLHLVKPLGFRLEDRLLRRAGLDYLEFATLAVHEDWGECVDRLQNRRLFAVTVKGTQRYDRVVYLPGDAFVFGPETRGLPPEVLAQFSESRRVRVPMAEGSRSLNLCNTVAVVLYEAMRQGDFGACR